MKRAWAGALLLAAAPACALEVSLDVAPAWRVDQFHWNIAGDVNGANPNILSELTWSDIRVQQLRLGGTVRGPGVEARLSWAAGRIFAGRNQDSDYDEDGRAGEFSRSNNHADMGETRDILASVGMPLQAMSGSVVTPLFGWTYATERLFMTQGNQTLATAGRTPPAGPFGGLNSNYSHKWTGVFLGVGSGLRATRRLSLEGELRYLPQLSFTAEADWNLRVGNGLPPGDPLYDPGFAHPVSFKDEANGKGWDLSLSTLYRLDDDMDVSVDVYWRRWRASDGQDRTFLGDGSVVDTRFNEVLWDTFSFGLTLRFRPFSSPDDESRRSPDEPGNGGLF